MYRGKFIVIDGIDGSGSTTHSKLLADWFSSMNYEVILTREPTDGKIGRIIRQSLQKDDKTPNPILDALLFAADRQDHQELIRNSIKTGKVIISDRYVESSFCYQGQFLDLEFIETINKDIIKPDITFILDIPVDACFQRKSMNEKYEKKQLLEKVRT
ncbi:MAG: dTMP kinase, partial [Candidatus Helarchaeales archaeon]